MAQTSRPWQGTTTGDAGAYSSAQWAQTWDHLIGNGDFANKGIIKNVDSDLLVQATSPASTSVEILAGAAIVNGRYYYNDATVTQAIASNASGSTRYDYIVLEADYTAQTVRIAVVQGTPSGGLPSLTQNASIWQIPLAYIELASGFSSISNSNITDDRTYANLPQNLTSEIINDSGGELNSGEVATWDTTSGDNNIEATTTAGDSKIAGVIEARTPNASRGKIITQGIYPVMCDEAVAIGDFLETSTTSGEAQEQTIGETLPFARVLSANSGANTKALAYINVLPKMNPQAGGANCFKNSAQALTTGVLNLLNFNIIEDDIFSEHNGLNSFVAKSAGYVAYSLSFKASVVSGTGLFYIYTYLSPANTSGSTVLSIDRSGGGADPVVGAWYGTSSGVTYMNIGDLINFQIYPEAVTSATCLQSTWCSFKRIL